jgi:formylglycine-generating enzyme required for sulfatase activity
MQVAPVWIGRREVTNEEYRRFLEVARGEEHLDPREPPGWRGRDLSAYASLPLSWISLRDATLFAEWAGCRLPTVHEWQKAARGDVGRLLPWGDAPGEAQQLANLGAEAVTAGAAEDHVELLWEQYASSARPVDWCPPGARGPHGLENVLGNVAEWTETMQVELEDGEPWAIPGFRLVAGYHYDSGWEAVPPSGFGLAGLESFPRSQGSPQVGLRLTKSRDPLHGPESRGDR